MRRTDLEYAEEQQDTDEHHNEAGDEPCEPVTAVSQTHHLHHLLQALLFLVHDALHYHGCSEDPRDRHEQWDAAADSAHKAATTDMFVKSPMIIQILLTFLFCELVMRLEIWLLYTSD